MTKKSYAFALDLDDLCCYDESSRQLSTSYFSAAAEQSKIVFPEYSLRFIGIYWKNNFF